MPKQIYELNDQWQFAWTVHGISDLNTPMGKAFDLAGRDWHPATVPGCVQNDLCRLELLDDPYYADNADHYRWCEEVDFWYRRSINPMDIQHEARAILHFEGLDTFATVWIDGKEIGRHANMFVPYWIDITEHLSPTRPVDLMIRLGATAFAAGGSDGDPCLHPPLQRIRSRKAQISWGWDIGPRIVTVGLWRPVRLEVIDQGRILCAGARTISIRDDKATLEAVMTVDWHGRPAPVKIKARYGPIEIDQRIDVVKGLNDIAIPFELSGPRLWWPRGYGRQEQYEFSVELVDERCRILDGKKGKFGVCRVDVLREPREENGQTFRLRVNDRDFFAKGLNWTPSDALFGRTGDDRIRRLVGLAAEANVNLLRVWGGGIYEPQAFWQACAEAGILVMQDFMFACSLYPQDQQFLEQVRHEAQSVVRAFRGHVSLALWCGDNEIDMLAGGSDANTVIPRRLLPAVLNELDPYRVYIPSSPHSPDGIDPNDPRYDDCHLWNHAVRADDAFYTSNRPNFISEMGRISFPSRKAIDGFMPKDKQWPVDHPLWRYHGSDTNRWGVYRNIPHVLQCVRANGYPDPQTLDELIDVTQKIQAEAYRFWIEHYGKDPFCWGIVLWNLCDCWGQVSDSIISHDLQLKPAYHAVKESFSKLDR
jgi:beta-mannosidase